MRWIGALVLVAALVAPVSAPSECPGQQVPPPPPAVEELGGPAPDPLPWPAEPVGGPLLGTCGEVGTAGAPPVSAASWVLADLDTGAVLAARAPHARHRPASTLKVLTALLVLRRLDPGAVVVGTAADTRIEGSKAGIGPGGRYTVRQLLAGLLLNSGNDAAHALARVLGGTAATVDAMTALAHSFGALDTRAATPSGLDGPGMASSAYDLALLFRIAMRDPLFAETIATRALPFPGYGAHPGFEMFNTSNLLAYYPDALGAKSGFTDAARHTLVGAAERDGQRLLFALMRGEQHPAPMWQQAASLLDWGFALPASRAAVGPPVARESGRDARRVGARRKASRGGPLGPTLVRQVLPWERRASRPDPVCRRPRLGLQMTPTRPAAGPDSRPRRGPVRCGGACPAAGPRRHRRRVGLPRSRLSDRSAR